MPKRATHKTEDLEQIYQRHAQFVYRYLLSLTGNDDLAEELTQETFVQAVGSIKRFDGSCKLTTWLCAIAKNQWRAYCRKHPSMLSLDVQPEEAIVGKSVVHGMAPSSEEEYLAAQERQSLFRNLHECPEPYREVLYLRILGGLSFRELADILGRSETWARVTYYRGKEKLRGKVKRDEE